MDSRAAERKGADRGSFLADPDAFRDVTEQYRRELHLHCYRMLGSYDDAEDGVQETMLRAWNCRATFEGRSSIRGWLYRIATNVCLTERTRRPTEPLGVPTTIGPIPYGGEPAIELTPYPDALLDELEASLGNPAAEYALRESVQLAFLAVIQILPPRQRAVLILHDVLGFSAAEVAEMLDSTTASVNSALNRARATMDQRRAAGRFLTRRTVPSDEAAQSLARRYVEAWQTADVSKLVGLLRSDVVITTMPPLPIRHLGRARITRFWSTIPPKQERVLFGFVPTRANRQPAMAVYRRRTGRTASALRPWGLLVFTVDSDHIAEIAAFTADPGLIAAFGLPAELVSTG